MRGMILAMAVAAGIGLGSSASVAAPASGAGLLDAAAQTNPLVQVQHWRWGSGHGARRSHWRWGSGGYGPRCRVQCNPWRCWRVCW